MVCTPHWEASPAFRKPPPTKSLRFRRAPASLATDVQVRFFVWPLAISSAKLPPSLRVTGAPEYPT